MKLLGLTVEEPCQHQATPGLELAGQSRRQGLERAGQNVG